MKLWNEKWLIIKELKTLNPFDLRFTSKFDVLKS